MTYLKLTFITPEKAQAFMLATGETDINQVHIGLINFVLKFDGLATCEMTGDAIEFYIHGKDGSWSTETVSNPVSRIKAGEVMEPFNTPIKMLSVPVDLWAENRIANRYQPFVVNPYFAEVIPQRSVQVIVVDSGINQNHVEFQNGDIVNLFNVPFYSDCTDDLGHGTGISALVAGATLGINPHAALRIIKISSKDRKPTLGELGDIFDQLLTYHTDNLSIPKVINLSWAIPRSAYLDQKINALIEAGAIVIAAAGNSDLNIDDMTPAGTDGVFTVGASTRDDKALYDVYGVTKKIGIYAPGETVAVPVFNSNTDYETNTGSSFSAAYVSGVASMLYGMRSQTPLANEVMKAITDDSTLNALILSTNVSQAENRMLHRPDTNSLPENNIQYLGVNVIGADDSMFVDVRMLMPASTLEQANGENVTYTLTYGDDSIAALMSSSSVTTAGVVNIRLNTGAILDPEVKVKQMWFTVTLECPGIKFVSPPIYYFLATKEATSSDIKPLLDELSASSSFTFLEEVDQESVVSKGIKS